jgi:hypothetical protein
MKEFIVQVVKTDSCYLYVKADNMADAIENAQEMVMEGALDDMDWEAVDGLEYYPVQTFNADNSI